MREVSKRNPPAEIQQDRKCENGKSSADRNYGIRG